MPALTGSKPRGAFWPTLAALAGVALTISLGLWQLGRAAEKRDLRAGFEAHATEAPIKVPPAELAAQDVELRRVEATGVFEPRHAVLVDNRMQRALAGYHVIMPLRIGESDRYVLVNRGWVARTAERSRLPEIRTPREAVTVSGVAVVPGRRILELSSDVIEGAIWQNLTIERYRGAMPLKIQPFVLRQDGNYSSNRTTAQADPPPITADDDGLVRQWDAPDFGIDKHYGYAFQWFALAATIVIIYLVFHVRRRRRAPAA